MTKPGKVFLERALSKLGLASRTETRAWILSGKLKVNGKIVTDPHYPVTPEKDKILLDGRLIEKPVRQTIMFYKPGSAVTTRRDEHGRRTVFDLLPDELKHLHPVGRLDMATTGLLIFTNDTKLSDHLTDPANAIPRTYLVTVNHKVTPEKAAKALEGVWDEGELLKPSNVILRKVSNKESHLTVELTGGKNREIRRLFKALGYEVTRIKRVAFGRLNIGELKPGEFRRLNPEESRAIWPGAGTPLYTKKS